MVSIFKHKQIQRIFYMLLWLCSTWKVSVITNLHCWQWMFIHWVSNYQIKIWFMTLPIWFARDSDAQFTKYAESECFRKQKWARNIEKKGLNKIALVVNEFSTENLVGIRLLTKNYGSLSKHNHTKTTTLFTLGQLFLNLKTNSRKCRFILEKKVKHVFWTIFDSN